MQLKLQRSQRMGGVLGDTVVFCLDVRADYSASEASNIGKYRLGGQVIYNSQAAKRHLETMNKQLDRVGGDSIRENAAGLARGVLSLAMAKMKLNVSIASLGNGHHIECKDLPELLAAEETLMEACRDLKKYLAAASTFSGSVTLVDFDDGEKAHVSQGTLDFAMMSVPLADPRAIAAEPAEQYGFEDLWARMSDRARELYHANPELVIIGCVAAVALTYAVYRFW